MRIVIPACLAAVALLGGVAISGCQQDRAQQRAPATQDYDRQQDQDGGAVRPRSGTSAPPQDGGAGGGN